MSVSCVTPKEEKKESRVNALPYYREATFTPVWMKKGTINTLQDFHQIPPFRFQNQKGEWVTEQKFKNKIYITDFFFTTCPGICPKMTNNMLLLQEAFEADTDVSVSYTHLTLPTTPYV